VVIFDRVIGLFSMLLLPMLFAPMFLRLIQGVAVFAFSACHSGRSCLGLLALAMLCLFNQPLVRLLERGHGDFQSGEISPCGRWKRLAPIAAPPQRW